MKATGKIILAVLVFLVCGNGFAQDMDAKIQKAVDDLAVRLNAPIEVSVGLIAITETNAPTEFSRYLHRKITFFAVSNGMYKVLENSPSSRGVSRIRPVAEQPGEITGTYQKLGGTVEVMLYLKIPSVGAAVSSSSFSVPLSELEKMGLSVLPENSATEAQVLQSEKIFAVLPGKNSFRIELWMDSPSGTYYEGDTMTVYFFSEKDCYYKMYYINAQGKMNLIYPTRRNSSNSLRANSVKVKKFACVPPYGNEVFLLMASEEPFAIADSDFAEADANSSSIEQALRGLRYQEGQRSAGSPAPVATARFSYTVLSKDSETR
jgi:hypothetical protein